jgi:hypothetical protein
MFFSISKEHKPNFSHFYQLGCFKISTDAGWKELKQDNHCVLYKGYADDNKLDVLMKTIIDQTEPQLLGNFCVLDFDTDTQTLQIKTDRYRSFPMYASSGNEVTNLSRLDYTVWTDSLIEINADFSINETKFDVIGNIDTSPLSLEEALIKIDQRLVIKTKNFVNHNDLPIKVFLSGGVDSLLVYSYLQRFTDNYELVRGNYFDYDKFWLMNSGTIRNKFWGYSQFHHWIDPCVLTSGAPGDEFMLRSPTTTNLFAQFYRKSIEQLLESDQWKTCLHYEYFHAPKNYKIFQEQLIDTSWDTPEKLMYNLCNIIVNDWQHWHLGNTITWTPLRDLEIFKILLRLSINDALGQIMNSAVSCKLIEQNKPGLIGLISDQKNSGNYMKNLADFLF